jgi:hypothetical protein
MLGVGDLMGGLPPQDPIEAPAEASVSAKEHVTV